MKMQRLAKQAVGFTLIELMIVIAIIGVLAAIAIPQYQRYAVRSEATQSLNAIRPFQLSAAEFAVINQNFPGAADNLPGIVGDDPEDTCSGIVEQVTYTQVDDDTIRLTASFYENADDNVPAECNDGTNTATINVPEELAGEDIAFLGNINNNGVVTWSIDGANTSVGDEYLPSLN